MGSKNSLYGSSVSSELLFSGWAMIAMLMSNQALAEVFSIPCLRELFPWIRMETEKKTLIKIQKQMKIKTKVTEPPRIPYNTNQLPFMRS